MKRSSNSSQYYNHNCLYYQSYWILQRLKMITIVLLIMIIATRTDSFTFPIIPTTTRKIRKQTINWFHYNNRNDHYKQFQHIRQRQQQQQQHNNIYHITKIRTTTSTTSSLLLTTIITSPCPLLIIDTVVARASIQATINLMTSICIGGWAATKNLGGGKDAAILDGSALHSLSKLAYWIFQPAFLCNSVARTIYDATTSTTATSGFATATATATTGMPIHLLFLMLLSALVHFCLGSIIGKIITNIIPLDPIQQNDIKMCTIFTNAGPLPLMFNDALFPIGSTIRQHVAAAISFYLLIWIPIFWIFGRDVLGISYKNLQNKATNNNNRFILMTKKILSPPIVGSIIGIIIGCIPILRNACYGSDTSAILRPVIGAITTLGSAYLPVAVLVLAGSLFGSESKSNKKAVIDDDEACIVFDTNDDIICTDYTKPSKQALLSIFIVRFIFGPIVSLGLLLSFQKLGWLYYRSASTLSVSVFTFVLLMQGCMPPTQNSVMMLQLEQEPQRAARMAKLLTTVYLLSIFPITILLSICLSRSGIMSFL